MKSAREMFEELGYKLKYKNRYEIEYIKPYEDNNYVPKEFACFYRIKINVVWKTISKVGSYISFSEHKAINKQLEELGWLDE